MGKQRIKPNYRSRVLRLPDLDHCKLAVLNSLGSPASRRVYEYAINQRLGLVPRSSRTISGQPQPVSGTEGSFEPSPGQERYGGGASRRMSCGTW
jgi:hypothetical protein